MHLGRFFFVALAAASLCGCGASLPSLTTGSLFGAKTPPPLAQNDPVARAMDVAATSARAVKCGYNFDPAKLKNQYLSSETATNPGDAAKLTQVYDTAFNGISKALIEEPDYCSADKTAKIKQALSRHLAGDYSPAPPEPVVQTGIFSGFGSGSSSSGGVDTKQVFEN